MKTLYERIISGVSKHFPILIILALITVIAATNNIAGTTITGGDNLHPEFDFLLNIKRQFFGVWQEYQGLGVLAVMAHASDLFREIFLWIVSIIIPAQRIRYFWTFLTLFIGGVGAYYLILTIIGEKIKDIIDTKHKLIALSGALFYILNLATLQQYYTPFEVFMSHFAFLPWLLLTAINYYKVPSLKNLLIGAIVIFLAAPGAYVPTLFVVYLMALGIVSLSFYRKRGNENNIVSHTKNIFKFLFVVFLINAFWLLPFIYFTIIGGPSVDISSKQNQIASPTVFLQNKEYGDMLSVMLLKGFWFSNVEPNPEGVYIYMLGPWRAHLSNIFVQAIGYSFFGVIILGFIDSLRNRKRTASVISFATLFVLSIIMLATATPPFSLIVEFLRDHLPLFGEVFRFPLTKFSLLAALSYSVFFAFGVSAIISFLKRWKYSYIAIFASCVIGLIIFMFPVFKGNFFYYRETISIPKEYFDAFSYLNTQDKNARIANFPQFDFWEWKFHNWGYSGSGFIWYGIPQSITDRAFDSWSMKNEDYYWELMNALYSKNVSLFRNVLNKYQISYLWLDRTRQNYSSTKNVFVVELEDMISQMPDVKKAKDFGDISIYNVALSQKPTKYVFTKQNLPSINSYNWGANDIGYQSHGDYLTPQQNDSANLFYPFRTSLFTQKSNKEVNFGVKESNNYMDFSEPLPETKNITLLSFLSPILDNNTLPATLTAKNNGDAIQIGFKVSTPSIFITDNGKTNKIYSDSFGQKLFDIPADTPLPLKININGVSNIYLNSNDLEKPETLGTASFSINEDNLITLSDSEGEAIDTAEVSADVIKSRFNQDSSIVGVPPLGKGARIIVRVPKIDSQYQGQTIDPLSLKDSLSDCDSFRKQHYQAKPISIDGEKWLELSAKNASSCVSAEFPDLTHDQSYLLSVKNRNVKGRNMHLWFLNESEDYAPIESYLPQNTKVNTSYFVIPPMEKFGLAYSVHLENISIGQDEVINDVGKIGIYPIPYNFINSITLGVDTSHAVSGPSVSVSHPNESLYTVTPAYSSTPYTLILSQAYDAGWQAFQVGSKNPLTESLPFLFGSRLNHVMVNNWENGWQVVGGGKSDSQVVIIYLPQYLEYVGLFLLGGAFGYFGWKYYSKRRKDITPGS